MGTVGRTQPIKFPMTNCCLGAEKAERAEHSLACSAKSLTTLAGLVNLALTVSSETLVSFAGGCGQFGWRSWSVPLVPAGICLAVCSVNQHH